MKRPSMYTVLIAVVMLSALGVAAFDARGLPLVLIALVACAVMALLQRIALELQRLNALLLGALKRDIGLYGARPTSKEEV